MGHVLDRWTTPDPDNPRRRIPTARKGHGKRWRARWTDPDGQERERSFDSQDEAAAHVRDMETAVATGTYIDPRAGQVTIGELATRWLGVQSQLKPSTYAWCEDLVQVYLLPRWKNVAAAKVTKAAVKEWLAKVAAELRVKHRVRDDAGYLVLDEDGNPTHEMRPLSPARVRAVYVTLRGVLQLAVDDRAIRENPADGVKLRRPGRKLATAIPADKLALIRAHLAAHGDCTQLLAETLAFSGLRWGEVVGMDVHDFDGAGLLVRLPQTEVNGRLIPGTPKGHRERYVPLPKSVAAALGAYVGDRTSGPLFLSPRAQYRRGGGVNSGRWHRGTFRKRWDDATDAAGLPGVKVHILRDTAVSLAIAAGADVKTVQHLVGHASGHLTIDVYGHMMPGRLEQVAERLEEVAGAALPDLEKVVPLRRKPAGRDSGTGQGRARSGS